MCPECWRRYFDVRVCSELHKGNGAVLRLLQVVKLGRHDGVVPSSSCLSFRAPVAAIEHACVRVGMVVTRACKIAKPCVYIVSFCLLPASGSHVYSHVTPKTTLETGHVEGPDVGGTVDLLADDYHYPMCMEAMLGDIPQ